MPPVAAKRPFSQTIPEPAPEPIQGTSIVVIHPGSYNFRLGRASDPFPVTVPHCIARRRKHPGEQPHFEDSWLIRPECQHDQYRHQLQQGLSDAETTLRSRPTSDGSYRQHCPLAQVGEINSQVDGEKTDVKSSKHWSQTDNKEYLVGDEALMVDPRGAYNLHWPMKRGDLNLHKGPGGTLTAVLQDLEDIWSSAIQSHLSIPVKDLKHYRAVLLIPDIYCRLHIRELMNLLLDRLGFAAAFVQQESVCAAFGAGMTSACIVDIGDQKTNICCVEDGMSLTKTRLCMLYGGADITRCFHGLLCQAGFPYRSCRLSKRMDALLLQNLKETYCHLDQDQGGLEEQYIQVVEPGRHIVKYTVHMGDERLLAPLAMFHPDLFGLQGAALTKISQKRLCDPSDPHDSDYLQQTQSKQEQAAKLVAARKKEMAAEANSQGTEIASLDDSCHAVDDEDTIDQAESVISVETPSLPSRGSRVRLEEEEEVWDADSGLPSLDQAVLRSIDKCENADMKRRMYSSIVVVGGGFMFPGAGNWLHYLLWTQMPAQFRMTLESIEIITRPKDLDPRQCCWKGGAILGCLDTAQELWIRQREWQRFGVRVLRERAPFMW